MPASLLDHVSTYTHSFFLVLRANSFRRGPLREHKQALRFRPGGAHALIGIDIDELNRADINLEDMFGSSAHRLRQRLLETPCPMQRLALLEGWLLRLASDPTPDPAIAYAIAELGRTPQVARIGIVQRETSYSAARFSILFRRHVGMSPKRYARLLRFRAVVAQAHPQRTVDWSRIAVDGGYYDQAHLSHEFREFAGITPTSFMAMRGPYSNHIALDE
ncbi:MAG: helix-turn-helix domain-containing protein [Rhodanobacter sp.]